ncbi:MAG: rnb [Myxococcaceae bacterium]|nr:rnb [Myxococcaceae bacterium]
MEPDFSAAALREADALAQSSPPHDASVRDLRELLWASIDNDESRDLDQLSVSLPGSGDATKILVAIADVAGLVQPDSAIDKHARLNTTSVYTAAGVFPMLPDLLSTDLTSLAERRDRLALVVELLVGADGVVQGSSLYRALVRNQAKLAYGSVGAWLAGSAAAPEKLAAVAGLEQQLRTQDRVAQAMRRLRHQHGALTLEASEARPVFAGDQLTDVRTEPQNRAKDLIEDFMIAANGVVARYLEHKGLPSLRRVLRSPARWPRIVELARALGEPLPEQPDAPALEAFLQKQRAQAPEHFGELSLAVVKLLGRGEYVAEPPGQEPPGHFGLAVRDYTHSTAPNRRFPDLVTQRLLKAALVGDAAPYDLAQLTELARRCTEREDAASKVERQVSKGAAALILEPRIGERFEALVTGASPKGTWVRVFQPAVEGKLVRGAAGLDVGQHVQVELVRTDVAQGFVDFALASEGATR